MQAKTTTQGFKEVTHWPFGFNFIDRNSNQDPTPTLTCWKRG